MTPFDPIGRLSRHVPEKQLHLLIRAGAVTLYLYMFIRRIGEYPRFLLKPLWFVESLIFLALAAAFLTRTDPVDRSKGAKEILVPLAGGLLPFALFFTPPGAAIAKNRGLTIGIFWGMTIATTITVWGMWTLRRSFSITVEARSLVTAGPYRFVRHPVYLGEILTTAFLAAWRPSIANLALFLAFAAIQLFRAKWEEEKLARNFPEYEAYAKTTWWFR